MNFNVGLVNPAVIMWDGTTARDRDISGAIAFGFSIEVVTTLTADATLFFASANGSDTDPNVPGAFSPLLEPLLCQIPSASTTQASLTIPAGTVAGTVLAATVPCVPGKFIRLTAGTNAASLRVVIVYHGLNR